MSTISLGVASAAWAIQVATTARAVPDRAVRVVQSVPTAPTAAPATTGSAAPTAPQPSPAAAGSGSPGSVRASGTATPSAGRVTTRPSRPRSDHTASVGASISVSIGAEANESSEEQGSADD